MKGVLSRMIARLVPRSRSATVAAAVRESRSETEQMMTAPDAELDAARQRTRDVEARLAALDVSVDVMQRHD